jgi:hypothetical protein
MVEHALCLALYGMGVFPVHGKIPLAGSHGLYDASTDAAQIRRLWLKHPCANIAYRTSAYRCVFDVDPRSHGDDTLFLLEQQYGRLQDTMRVQSGGLLRGIHYYLTSLVAIPNKVNLGAGIDVLAEGGYAVCPPSVHPLSGNRYRWDIGPDEMGPQPLPERWVERCLAGGVKEVGPHVLEADGPIYKGHRTAALADVAIRMRRAAGLTASMLVAALGAMHQARCVPPKEHQKVVAIAHYVFGHYQPDPVMRVGRGYLEAVIDAVNGTHTDPQASTTSTNGTAPQMQWDTPRRREGGVL